MNAEQSSDGLNALLRDLRPLRNGSGAYPQAHGDRLNSPALVEHPGKDRIAHAAVLARLRISYNLKLSERG